MVSLGEGRKRWYKRGDDVTEEIGQGHSWWWRANPKGKEVRVLHPGPVVVTVCLRMLFIVKQFTIGQCP